MIRAGNLRQAKVYIEAAERPWNSIHQDYKGQFDPNHPEIVAIKQRIAALRAKIEGCARKPSTRA